MIRRMLDLVYVLSGILAAIAMIAILILIMAQVITRLLGIGFPGGADYAGYAMAAASFFGFAYAFRQGGHIRVSLILDRLPDNRRRPAEVVCLTIASGLCWYFAWYAIKAVQISHMLGDVSQGQDATPIWIPQLAMASGTVLLAIAVTDQLVSVLKGGEISLGPAREA